MHIVRYRTGRDRPQVGVRHDRQITPLAEVGTMADLFALPLADIRALVEDATDAGAPAVAVDDVRLLPPIDGRGEVWCAGVTYARSRGARMEESSEQSVYDKVYVADRPELFLKSPAWRVVTDGEPIGIRADSGHDVPEPELAVVVNAHGETVGYTVCNDVSSRSIEGENPLYIPQAKVFAGGCALATGIRPAWEVADPTALTISLGIRRSGSTVLTGTTSTSQLARPLDQLVEFLCRPNAFPDGAILATGTGVVPEMDFALRAGDMVDIEIEEVGRLTNQVALGVAPFDWLTDENGPRPTCEEQESR